MIHPLLLLASMTLQRPTTQPPAHDLLDDRGFASALVQLAKSPRVRLETIGRSHRGRPIVLIVVAEPHVLVDLEKHRVRAKDVSGPGVEHPTLGSPRFEERNLDTLLATTRLPVLVAGDSWGHEAAQVEGLVKAARTLAFEDSEEVRRTLTGTIALLIPLMNPDGRAQAIEEWKRTPLSSGDSGAGNAYGFLLNRDFLHCTQPESRAVVETVLKWRPVVVVDQHEDMFSLGVHLPEVCFVEPFEPGLDVEEHPLTRGATVSLGKAIAAGWRRLGFRALFLEEGDNRFAPLPRRGEGLNPMAGSAGRLNLMATLHGIVSFITESARTPGAQSWEDRVEQKASSALATLLEVSRRPARYARAVYERRLEEAKKGGERFVVIPEEGQPRDGLEELLEILGLHQVTVYRVSTPYRAFVVPLAQPEANVVRHLLLAERSRLNELPPALGVKILASESLSEADHRGFLGAPLEPGILLPVSRPATAEGSFTTVPTVRSTALVNRLLASGAASVYRFGDVYLLEGSTDSILWHASVLGVPVHAVPKTPRPPLRRLRTPRVAIYNGQGVSEADWGEIAWALERAGFPYGLIDEAAFAQGQTMEGIDILLVPNGSAPEIVSGWNPEAPGRSSPWQPSEPSRGIGQEGLAAMRSFVEKGGTYIGLGSGGALLAGNDYLGITDTEMVPSAVGIGQVRLRVLDPESRLAFGYPKDQPIAAFFYGPPGTPDRGFAFTATDSAVAAYDGAREFPDEISFISTDVLAARAGHAAIVHERRGRGHVVLFGVAPAFRGEWKSTFRWLYNALYLPE